MEYRCLCGHNIKDHYERKTAKSTDEEYLFCKLCICNKFDDSWLKYYKKAYSSNKGRLRKFNRRYINHES